MVDKKRIKIELMSILPYPRRESALYSMATPSSRSEPCICSC